MPVCNDPFCKLEVRDGETAGEKLFLDEKSGRVISLVRHDSCAEKYEAEGVGFRRISPDEKRLLLSPASALKNELAARRLQKKQAVKR